MKSRCEQILKFSTIFSIVFVVQMQDECPDKKYYSPCWCTKLHKHYSTNLWCFNLVNLPPMVNMSFGSITLSNVKLSQRTVTNLTCSILTLDLMHSDNVSSVQYLFDLQYKLLVTQNTESSLIKRLLKPKQYQLTHLDLYIAEDSWVVSDLSHLVNLKSLTIMSTKVTLESYCLSKNRHMERLMLSGVVKELQDNSLVFHSEKAIIIDLAGNRLKLDTLRKSNLSNFPGGFNKIDLYYNYLEYLDKRLFLPWIQQNSNITINLDSNYYIECNCHDTSWVFDNFHVINNLKNVECYNHEDSNLFDLTKDDLCGKTTTSSITDYSIVTNSKSTSQQISTTEPSLIIPTTIDKDETRENEASREKFRMLWWHIILIIIAFVLLLFIVIYSVVKIRRKNNKSDQNKAQQQPSKIEGSYTEEIFNIRTIELPSSPSPRSSVARHHYDSISGVIDNSSNYTILSEPESIDRQSDLSIIPLDEL